MTRARERIARIEVEPYSVGKSGRTGIPTSMRNAVLKRDRHRCRKCGSPHALELHHVLEVSRGGKHSVANLHALCERCHAEWTWAPPRTLTYTEWLKYPPAHWFIDAAHAEFKLNATDKGPRTAGVIDRIWDMPFSLVVAMLAGLAYNAKRERRSRREP